MKRIFFMLISIAFLASCGTPLPAQGDAGEINTQPDPAQNSAHPTEALPPPSQSAEHSILPDEIIGSVLPHLMVNDQLYWLSTSICSDGSFTMEDGQLCWLSSFFDTDGNFFRRYFTYIGEVEEDVEFIGIPEKNFQACGVPKGTRIFCNFEFPQIVYLQSKQSITPVRYATSDVHDFLYHDGRVYVSLTSIHHQDYAHYDALYGHRITVEQLPEGSMYLGDTCFIGFDMFVQNEMESNHFWFTTAVYQDPEIPDILYAGEHLWLYVPLEDHERMEFGK